MIHTLDLNFQGIGNAIAAFLIETSEGPALIETGPHSTLPVLEDGIKKLGFEAGEIQNVLLTHIHLDHAGAAWAFAEKGATIHMHPFGVRHMQDPSKLMESARRIYQDKMDVLWGDMKSIPPENILAIDHEQELNFGDTKIIALHTPGHAKHHIAWQMDDIVFTGDVAGVKIDEGPVVPPCPPPDINIEDWESSIELVLSRNVQKLMLTHFGEIKNISEHFDALKAILHDWANWIRDKSKEGLTADEMTPLFSKYTADQLRGQGVSEKGVKQYEAANPSWMSVAGLLRYWDKKKSTI